MSNFMNTAGVHIENMTVRGVMEEVCKRKLNGLMIHSDLADIFNVMNLHGFKRKSEYRFFKEQSEFMHIKKFVIDRHGFIPDTHDKFHEINPMNVISVGTRGTISRKNRMEILKTIFMELINWESETISMLSECYHKLEHENCLAEAEEICELIEGTDRELKYLKREFYKYNDLDWDMTFIEMEQKNIHDKFKKKMSKIDICTR